jgi:hypothetical protein
VQTAAQSCAHKSNNTHAAQVQRARGAAGQGAAGVAATVTATARCARDECPFRALLLVGMKMVRIFSDRIRDRICLEGF